MAKKKTYPKKKTAKKATAKRRLVVKRSKEPIITSTSVNSTYPSPPKDSKPSAVERKSNVEQPKEDVMADSIYAKSVEHQTEKQEGTFQRVLRNLCDQGPAGDEFRRKALEESELEEYNLSAEQQVALLAVGHACGKYTFVPGVGYCCCC